MKSILRSTAILGSSTFITIILGIISSKLWAIWLGPSGLGLFGLFQSMLGLLILIAGLGINTGIVRLGAQSAINCELEDIKHLEYASWILISILWFMSFTIILFLGDHFRAWFFGDYYFKHVNLILGIALFFALASSVQVGFLNAFHYVGTLAKYAVGSSILTFGSNVLIIYYYRETGLPYALLSSTFLGFILTIFLNFNKFPKRRSRLNITKIKESLISLITFGGPYTLSMIVGTGVQLSLPFLVFQELGTEGVGYYKAATTISVGYLTFFLNAMAQDYYPRVCAVKNDSSELNKIINEQNKIVLLLVLPLIIILQLFSPWIIPILYSKYFLPVVGILGWQLIGDLFKLSSFSMSYVILAKSKSTAFFATEIIGGTVILLSSWIGIKVLGLSGLGIAFFVSYFIYYFVVLYFLNKAVVFSWSFFNKTLILLPFSVFLLLRILDYLGLETLRLFFGAIALISMCVITFFSIFYKEGFFNGQRIENKNTVFIDKN